MENTKYPKMTPQIDIRQSEKWLKQLEELGWVIYKTTSGISVATKNLKLFSVTKVQRPKNITQQDINEIDAICKKTKTLFIKIEPFCFEDVPLLEKNGYLPNDNPLSPPSTFYIDLTKSEEELWANLSESAKYSIKRSKREGTILRYYQNPLVEKLKPYYEMCQETGKQKHFWVEPYSYLLSKVKVFGKEGHLVLAYDKAGRLLSGKYYLCFNDMVLYSTGGTTAIGRKTKAGYQLLWDSILYFKGMGYKVLDLEGRSDDRFAFISKNWIGFTHFKEKYGPQVYEFPVIHVKYYNKILEFFQKIFKTPL